MRKLTALLLSGIIATGMITASSCKKNKGQSDNIVADKYKITIACQTEMGEEEVLKVLKKAYEDKNPDVEVEVKTFSGEGFEQYMLGIAAQQDSSPNIIWTADTYHSQWDEYFTDLRPYYESSPETDYSLYYETMLDTTATHGYFKPTKNYTGSFRSNDKDTATGYEDYKNHSPYGIYYAPRDYNKPAILCNTHLFEELDSDYEKVYKAVESVSEMPTDYIPSTTRLNSVVAGENWDEMDDLYQFVRFIAERIVYIINNAHIVDSSRVLGKTWAQRVVLNLFLEWEPTYTTILNDLGIDLLSADGTLNIAQNAEKFGKLHDTLFPSSTEAEKDIASVMTTTNGGVQFSSGRLFMSVCSRPVVLGYSNTFKGSYGEPCLQAICFPTEKIAAGNSGYAISNVWEGKGMTVNGVYKSYTDLSWDFIKFIITEEGQEIAGQTGLNIPVLKKLYSAETNGGVVPSWRKVESLGDMSNDAWVAGGELSQNTYNIFVPQKRNIFRSVCRTFFVNLQRTNYNEGSLDALIKETERSYELNNPKSNLRG